MMEIPSGKWCSSCPLCQYDSDDCLFYCRCQRHGFDSGQLQDEVHGKIKEIDENDWRPIRCPACLFTYPNGAAIEIKPK